MDTILQRTPSSASKEEEIKESVGASAAVAVPDLAAQGDAKASGLQRGLTSRHVGMISIAGTIGTGLFLGTGSALVAAGPGSLTLSYGLIGILVYFLMNSVSEMCAQFPIVGGWPTYAQRFLDEGFGFTLGWLTAIGTALTMAADLTSTSLLMAYWTPHVNWLPGLIFVIGLAATNLVTVKAYGEVEYWLAILKLVSIVIFFILGIVVNAGGNTSHEYIGAKNWTVGDAPFVGGFGALVARFISTAYSYSYTESVGLAAAEAKNPHRNIPKIASRVMFRIAFFYISTIVLISFDISYLTPGLSTGTATTSPFTLVFQAAGAKAGGSFMNAVILTSVLSAANMAIFGGSRILYGMSLRGHAPRFFSHLTKRGVPWASILAMTSLAMALFGLSFLPGKAEQLFLWLQHLVGVNGLVTWVAIGACNWRMRAAWIKQGRPITSMVAPNVLGGFCAPFVTLSFGAIVIIAGYRNFRGGFNAQGFVASYLELPVILVLYCGFRFFKKCKTPSLLQIDLVTGQHVNTEEDEEDNEINDKREHGRYGILWKMYGWVA
ncbi:hypothetical protein JCM8097_006121 [Rhodosporidiobolus ruineniae]